MKGLLLLIFLGISAEMTLVAAQTASYGLFNSQNDFDSEPLDARLNVTHLGRLLIACTLLPALSSETRTPALALKLHHFIQGVSQWTLTSSQIAGIAVSCGLLGYYITKYEISQIDSNLIMPFTFTVSFASCIPTLAKAAKRSAKAGLDSFRLALSSPPDKEN